jgi:hypothetical protein
MIKHPGTVPNLARLDFLGATQDEIIILRAFKAGAETGCFDQLRFENTEMGKKILGKEKLSIPIRLEVDIASAPGGIELVFVAIE